MPAEDVVKYFLFIFSLCLASLILSYNKKTSKKQKNNRIKARALDASVRVSVTPETREIVSGKVIKEEEVEKKYIIGIDSSLERVIESHSSYNLIEVTQMIQVYYWRDWSDDSCGGAGYWEDGEPHPNIYIVKELIKRE